MSDTTETLSPEERKRRQAEDRKKQNEKVVRDLRYSRGQRHSTPARGSTPPPAPTKKQVPRAGKKEKVICLRHPGAGASMILSCAVCMRVWNANSIRSKSND